MLLEPRCTDSITSSWHALCIEIFVCLLCLTKTKQDQVLPMGKFGPTDLQHSIWLGFFSFSHFILGHPVHHEKKCCISKKRILFEKALLRTFNGEASCGCGEPAAPSLTSTVASLGPEVFFYFLFL